MRDIDNRRFEMFIRVVHYTQEHADLFPKGGPSAQAAGELETAVAQLQKYVDMHRSNACAGQGARIHARKELVARLRTLVRTARIIARDVDGADKSFYLSPDESDCFLVHRGRAFIAAAAPLRDRFVGYGMPATFLAEVEALVVAFEGAAASRQSGRQHRAVARDGIRRLLASAFAAVQKLDVIVANQLHGDPVRLAGWAANRRVGFPGRAGSVKPPKLTLAAPGRLDDAA